MRLCRVCSKPELDPTHLPDERDCIAHRFDGGLSEDAAKRLYDARPPKRESSIYLIGSMKNPRVQEVAAVLRGLGYDVFDDWQSSGPEADDYWQKYERARGRTFREALSGHHAKHVFELDKKHIERCTHALLVCPAGKSGHLELGIVIGAGKPGYILLDGEPERFDVMYQFATGILVSLDELRECFPLVLP